MMTKDCNKLLQKELCYLQWRTSHNDRIYSSNVGVLCV